MLVRGSTTERLAGHALDAPDLELGLGADVTRPRSGRPMAEQVTDTYGYGLSDPAERRRVDRLVEVIVFPLADLGPAERSDQEMRLTALGGALASAASVLTNDDEPE